MEASKKKALLGKMQMPMKSKDPMLSMDDSEMALDAPDAEGQEAPDAEGMESPAEESKELKAMPDNQLAKELEARGWKVSAPEGSPEEESAESPEEEKQEDDQSGY